MIHWGNAECEQFKKLCSIFCTKDETKYIMGVTRDDTFARLIAENFPDTPTWKEAFDRYSSDGKMSLRRKQVELALDGDRTMLIWLGKQQLGQSEPYKKTEAEPTADKKKAKAQKADGETLTSMQSKFMRVVNG